MSGSQNKAYETVISRICIMLGGYMVDCVSEVGYVGERCEVRGRDEGEKGGCEVR